MSFPVYSTRFLSGIADDVGDDTTLRYTVPAGKVAVVRSVDIWCFTTGIFRFGRIITGNIITITSGGGIAAGSSRTLETHQVFTAGEIMGISYGTGAWSISVSGFLLNQL